MDVADMKGLDLGTSEWLEITQDRIDAFADATGDHQWIHVDPERAAAGPYGSTIAHGFLTLSLLPYLNSEIRWPVEGAKMTINYGLDRVRFITPIPVGSRVRSHVRIIEAAEVDGGIQFKSEVTVELQGSERPGCVAETLSRVMLG
ncbi:MAG: MaoC family dehydratase [Acidimicrobiia bacterium]